MSSAQQAIQDGGGQAPPVGRERPIREAGEAVAELCGHAEAAIDELVPKASDALARLNAILSRVDQFTAMIAKLVHPRAAGGDAKGEGRGEKGEGPCVNKDAWDLLEALFAHYQTRTQPAQTPVRSGSAETAVDRPDRGHGPVGAPGPDGGPVGR